MSDVNQTSPTSSEAAPQSDLAVGSEIAAFMNFDVLSDDAAAPESANTPPPADATEPTPTAEPASPATPLAPANGTPQPEAQPQTPAPAPDLMADMLATMAGTPTPPQNTDSPGGHPPTADPSRTSEPVAPQPQQQPPATADEYLPFNPNSFNIPPQLEAALFEGDNPQTRNEALRILLSTVMNASAQAAVQQVREAVLPSFAQVQSEAMGRASVIERVNSDIFGAFPDLAQYPGVVQSACRVMAQRNPNMPWGPETVQAIGNLAKQFVNQTRNPQPAQTAPQFVDPGARPAAPLTSAPTPASELDDLLQF